MTPLRRLTELGQSVWYDYIRRDLYQGQELKRLIEDYDLRGMTSNPTIFAKAIVETDLYDEEIRRLAANGASADAIFEALVVDDVRGAADVFRPVFESTGGDDGFVSIEVRPQFARDTQGSIAEARRLWSACDRPNVMVKIPATAEGIPAIRQCLAEGININITLLFSVPRYREVMEAYLSAMEQRVSNGQEVDRIRSVASFFVSRTDTNVNKELDAIARDETRSERDRRRAADLRGKVAIANARIAYQAFETVFHTARFTKLKERELVSSGRSGPRPLRKIRRIRTCTTSRPSSHETPWTRCRHRRSLRTSITANRKSGSLNTFPKRTQSSSDWRNCRSMPSASRSSSKRRRPANSSLPTMRPCGPSVRSRRHSIAWM